jgi:hypothetical protein
MKEANAVIVNLTGQSWTLHRSYGTFTVRGCDAAEANRGGSGGSGDAYTLTPVTPRTAVMDLGDKRTVNVPITAAEVAEDLCHEINADGGDDSYFGVFVAAGDSPTEEELAQSSVRLAAFYRRLVAAADREWERSHSYLFINDVERRAALYLGVEKEWFYQPRETVECPGCGEKIKPGFAVCKTCGAILDHAKAATLGLVKTPVTPSTAVSPVVHAEAAKPTHTAAPVRR